MNIKKLRDRLLPKNDNKGYYRKLHKFIDENSDELSDKYLEYIEEVVLEVKVGRTAVEEVLNFEDFCEEEYQHNEDEYYKS